MKNNLSKRLKKIQPSLTVAINVKANALRAEGRDVLVLAAGEPDFDTPQNICQAAIRAINEGETPIKIKKVKKKKKRFFFL